jgi:hypothetical protein
MPLAPVTRGKSAFPEKAGVVAPTALLETKSMSDYTPTADNSDAECPTCGRDDFESRFGLKQHHARTHGERLDDRPELTCEYCGEVFRVKPCREDEARFCSQKCGVRWRSENKPPSHFPAYDGGKITKTCEVCGSDFKVKRHKDDQITCSHECAGKYRSKEYSGPQSPHWRGGKSIADAVKKSISETSWRTVADSVREANGGECEMCGKTADEIGQKPDVHHIVPISAGGCNAPENLMVLCRGCHRIVESYTRDLLGMEAVLCE